MSSPPTSEVRLHRSVLTRLFGGGNFQWVLTLAVLLYLAAIVIVASFAPGRALLGLVAVLVPGTPWVFGVTAYARAEADGVHWRDYRPHSYSWAEISQVEFGSVVRGGASAASRIPVVRFVVAGHAHPVGPTAGVGLAHLTHFAHDLAALARVHGVSAGATSPATGGRSSSPVRAGTGSVAALAAVGVDRPRPLGPRSRRAQRRTRRP